MSFFFSLDALQALSIISVDLTAVSASLPELELRKRAGEVVVGAVGACVCACVYVCMGVCMCVCVMKVVPACKPVLPVLCAECLMLVLSVLTTVQHIGGTHSSQLQRIGGTHSSQLQRIGGTHSSQLCSALAHSSQLCSALAARTPHNCAAHWRHALLTTVQRISGKPSSQLCSTLAARSPHNYSALAARTPHNCAAHWRHALLTTAAHWRQALLTTSAQPNWNHDCRCSTTWLSALLLWKTGSCRLFRIF
jgi:hypothetical protein